jgi:hypothetical protein
VDCGAVILCCSPGSLGRYCAGTRGQMSGCWRDDREGGRCLVVRQSQISGTIQYSAFPKVG